MAGDAMASFFAVMTVVFMQYSRSNREMNLKREMWGCVPYKFVFLKPLVDTSVEIYLSG